MDSIKIGILILLLLTAAPAYATTVSIADEDAMTPNAITNTFGAVVVSPDLRESTVGVTGTTTVNITLSNVADYGAGTIHIYYDRSVVDVDSYGPGDSTDAVGNNPGAGCDYSGHWVITACNPYGLSGGNMRFATVTFAPAAGSSPGECSKLNLMVETLYDRNFTALQSITKNGSICITESDAPVVTAPKADPPIIVNDTPQMRARVPGTRLTNLSVHATDATWVDSAYIDLTPILGPGNDMVQMTGPDGGNNGDWWIVTNAAYSSPTDCCCLTVVVSVKDHHGNWNNGTRVTLTVRRRGDMTDGGSGMDDFNNVVGSGDYLRIMMYTVGLVPAPDPLVAEIVPADS